MPYNCVQKGGKWICQNQDTGKVHGKHDTKAECNAQLRALYANTKENM